MKKFLFLLIEQSAPPYPFGHVHVKPPKLSFVQLAEFLHGLAKSHGKALFENLKI